jgi:hypothetical protein
MRSLLLNALPGKPAEYFHFYLKPETHIMLWSFYLLVSIYFEMHTHVLMLFDSVPRNWQNTW